MRTLDGILFARMINSGAANLKAHAKEINDLNVFPIPDGDTGDNMLLTMMGGIRHDEATSEGLDEMSRRVSSGMLLSARGNSGVILSQFFEGIKNGFAGLQTYFYIVTENIVVFDFQRLDPGTLLLPALDIGKPAFAFGGGFA